VRLKSACARRKAADYIDAIVRPIAGDCSAAFSADSKEDLSGACFEPIAALTLARTFTQRVTS